MARSSAVTTSSGRELCSQLPIKAAITCLVGALLLEQSNEWAVQHARYMTLEAMGALGETAAVSLPTLPA
jgi:hypothetical protein